MLGHIKIHNRGPTPRGFRQAYAEAAKSAWETTGAFWHDELRPKHFTHAGAKEYKYLPRKGDRGNPHPQGFRRSYQGRKFKKFGHTYPLVFTGESLTLTRARDIRSTAKGVRNVYRAYKFNWRNKASKINMRDEFTRFSARELPLLAKQFETRLHAELQHAKQTTTETIRS